MPVESAFTFYPRYVGNLVEKHVKLAKAVWRYRKFVLGLKRDPNARNYTDLALTPVVDDDYDTFEMFTVSEAAKSAVTRLRKPDSRLVTVGQVRNLQAD